MVQCRSGAWTPPWSDADFDKFADAVANQKQKIYQDAKFVEPRKFTPPDEEAVQKMREQMHQVFGVKQNENKTSP